MTTRKDAGMCLACGQEAKLRCSSCATKSGLDLFFCSKEHQRLVWPFHRLVCGERAHPFALPSYSKQEADILLDRMKAVPVSPRLAQLKRDLFASLRITPNDLSGFEAFLKPVIGQGGQILRSTISPTSASTMDDLVVCLRQFNHEWTTEGVDDWTRGADDSIDFFTYLYGTCTDEAPDTVADRWTSTFCHHLGATVPLSSSLMEVVRQAVGNESAKLDPQSVSEAELRQMPGGKEARQALQSAFAALRSFLLTAPTPKHQAFARAARIELEPINEPGMAILVEKR